MMVDYLILDQLCDFQLQQADSEYVEPIVEIALQRLSTGFSHFGQKPSFDVRFDIFVQVVSDFAGTVSPKHSKQRYRITFLAPVL